MAGKHFYCDFMYRFIDLLLKRPKSTSLVRCLNFNESEIQFFFDKLEKLIKV